MSSKEKSIFRNTNFLLLFTGGLVSRIGNAVHYVGLTWFVLELTGSGAATGIILFLSTIPGVIVSPFGGVVADRVSRKLLIVGMDLIRGIAVIFLSWAIYTDVVTFIHLAVITVILAVCGSFFNPAVSATIPNIVLDRNLQKANSIEHFSQNFSQVIGFALGGILIAIFGVAGVFLLNGISFIISAISELFINIPPVEKTLIKHKTSFFSDFKFGVKYLFKHKTILSLFNTALFLNFITSGIMAVGIPYVFKEVIAVGSKLFGFAQAVTPAGAFIGAIVMNFLPEIKKYYKVFIINITILALLLLGFSFTIMPSVFKAYGVNNVYLTLLVILATLGIINAIINIPIMVLLQRIIPDEIRGRIFGLIMSLSQGLVPISMAITGYLFDLIAAYLLFAYTGGFTLVVAFVMTRVKALRNLNKKAEDNIMTDDVDYSM